MNAAPSRAEPGAAAASAILAFLIWGAVPLYFKQLAAVPATEIVAHRVLWSVPFILALLLATRRLAGLRLHAANPRLLGMLALSAALMIGNWLTFVWAVNADRVIEASLGYFINPLVSMCLGYLVLGERLRPVQVAAVALAVAGVANQVWQLGALPWVSLLLAFSFAFYGLLRKRLPVDAVSGLFIETLLAAPAALAYLAWAAAHGPLAFGRHGWGLDALLAAAGPVTAVPLMLFAAGARHLSLSALGFLQFIAPTLTFLLAVLVFREPLGSGQLITFMLIWSGLGLYTADALRAGAGR